MAVTFVLWPHGSHAGLLIAVALVLLNALMHFVLHLRLPVERDWIGRLVLCQLVGGLSWALLPWLARPTDPVIQTLLARMLLRVLASNAIFGPQVESSLYAFQAPVAIVGAAGIFAIAEGNARWNLALVLFAGVFSAGLAHLPAAAIQRQRSLACGAPSWPKGSQASKASFGRPTNYWPFRQGPTH